MRSSIHFTGARTSREKRGSGVLLAVDVDLAAEAASHLRRDRPHLVLAQAHHGGRHRPQDVRVLRRAPDGQVLATGLVLRDHAPRLHRVRRQTLVQHPLREHDVRLREGRVQGAVVLGQGCFGVHAGAAPVVLDGDVAREAVMQRGGLIRHRRLRVDHRR